MKTHLYCLALCLSLVSRTLYAGDPDFELTHHVTFTVESNGDAYGLVSHTEVTQKFLSKRSTSMTRLNLSEQFYDPINHLRARFRGEWLDKDHFSFAVNPGEDVFISDFKVHTIRLPQDIQSGDEAYYEYRQEYQDPAFMPLIVVPNMDFVKEWAITIEHPEEISVEFDFFFPGGAIPYTVEQPGKKETVLKFKDIHLRKSLTNFPFNRMQAAVQIRLAKGSTALTPTSIEEFTRWYSKLFAASPAIAQRHSTLLQKEMEAAKTPRDKLRVIHDYVRGKIRYIADEHELNAFVPRDPSLVLDRGYGDCKDRALLVSALARHYGLNVFMALISTDPRPIFKGTHVTQFNHVICAFDDGSQTMFFDPTDKYCEFGNLPESDIGAEVLVLDFEHPRRVSVPAPNRNRSIDIEIRATLDSLKKGKAHITLRNDFLQSAAQARERKTGLDLENVLSDLVTSQFQKISFDYFEFESQQDSAITFTATADISEFVISSPTRRYLPQMPFRMIEPEVLERSEDSFPVFNPYRVSIGMKIDLDAPGYTSQSTTLAFGTDHPARFSAQMTSPAAGRYRLEYDMAQHDKQMEGELKGRYLEFCRSFLQSKKNMFVFTKE